MDVNVTGMGTATLTQQPKSSPNCGRLRDQAFTRDLLTAKIASVLPAR